jgi:hypothetical protein
METNSLRIKKRKEREDRDLCIMLIPSVLKYSIKSYRRENYLVGFFIMLMAT